MFAPLGVQLVRQADLGIPEAEEPHVTFVENALAKARHASACSGLPALADDSGICVAALGGAPGVQSARYSGANATDQSNIRKLLADLERKGITDRSARFRCVVALALPTGEVTTSQGSIAGRIATEPRGTWGFGYDPVFQLEDGRMMAELEPAEKNQLSHRAIAFRAILPAVLALSQTRLPVSNGDGW